VPAHQRGQPVAAVQQARLVEGLDAAVERWMVHEEHRRLVRLLPEPRLEPGQALRAEFAMALALDQRVERNQANRPTLDRVLQEARGREIALGGEGRAQRLARI